MDDTSLPRWHGRWIWDQTDGTERNVYVQFRRDFELRSAPTDATLRITASSRYRVWVNGTFLGEGPPKSQPFLTYFDEYDLGESGLLNGDNVVCVLVNHTGYDDDSRGGLLAEIRTADEIIVATDESWRVQQSDAWRRDTYFVHFNRVVPYQEHFSALRFDARWLEARFDDSDWCWAAVVSSKRGSQPPIAGPWVRIVKRDIPPMTLETRRAVSVMQTGANTAAMNRMRSEDLSIGLSQPLAEMRDATIGGVNHLLVDEGETSFACSATHRTDPTQGIREPGVILDFGSIINAYVELDLEGPPGARLEIGYAERLLDGEFSNVIEGQFADSVTVGKSRVVWRAFAWKAFRFLRIRVRDAFSPLIVHDLRAIETRYPFATHEGFASDDAELSAIFEMCRYTTHLACNEYITDTPWREQGQWLGDVSAVTLGSIYACFGDTALARKFLTQSGATQYPTGFLGNMTNTYSALWQGVLPDFSLWWLMALRDYYRYTGETEIVHALYGVAIRLVEAVLAYRGDDGLITDMPYHVFIDWADVGTTGTSAAFNAIVMGALEAMEELAAVRGDQFMADRSVAAKAKIAESFDKTFWIDDESLFADNVDANAGVERFSEHSNAAAIAFGLSTRDQTDSIIERLWARGDHFLAGTNNGVTEANPFFTAVILKALTVSGRQDVALRLLRDRWGRRMVNQGSSSTHEEWSVHGSWRSGEFTPIIRTMSHAWSAAPAQWLVQSLAGIEILEPGCAAICVRPAKTDFTWQVEFPTPYGSVRVDWNGSSATVQSPDGVRVER